MELYNWSLLIYNFIDERKFSRIIILKDRPNNPDQNPKIKYKIPISL